MSKLPNFFVDVRKDLVYASGWPSRPIRSILKVKRASKRAYPPFRRFSCAIANHFLGYPDSDLDNANLFLWTSVKTFSMYTVGHHGLSEPIWRVKRDPKRAYASFRRFLCAIAHHFLGDPDSDVKNAKCFLGRPSRPCLCIRLAITDCPAHLEGQTSPEASIHLISTISCAIAYHFLGDPDSDVKNATFFRGCPSRACLCIRLAITACPTHLEGQTSPEASIPLISTIIVCYSIPFFG